MQVAVKSDYSLEEERMYVRSLFVCGGGGVVGSGVKFTLGRSIEGVEYPYNGLSMGEWGRHARVWSVCCTVTCWAIFLAVSTTTKG